jgi:murein DD-endopeptidase MepM/ murein hydrolase activator NlpD
MLAHRPFLPTLAIALLAGAATATAESRHAASLVTPVSPSCISSPYGPRVLPNEPQAGTYHYGIDLPAPEGSPVLAAAAGTVIRIQSKGPGGLEMLVQHDGFVGIYSHFSMVMPEFTAGTRVVAGQQLGFVGNTGVSSGAHLYFEMILAGHPVDPARYLALRVCGGTSAGTQTVRLDSGNSQGAGRQFFQILPTGEVYQGRPR